MRIGHEDNDHNMKGNNSLYKWTGVDREVIFTLEGYTEIESRRPLLASKSIASYCSEPMIAVNLTLSKSNKRELIITTTIIVGIRRITNITLTVLYIARRVLQQADS